ncbi:MAG: DUF1292 domain-containing protein [Christensenellales bacterium]
MEEEKSVFEQLLDENDDSNIVLIDEDEKEIEFEQIAVIPVKEQVFAILKPVKKMEGVGENEGLVFELEETPEGEELLNLLDPVEDEDMIDVVFAEYDKLLQEDNK